MEGSYNSDSHISTTVKQQRALWAPGPHSRVHTDRISAGPAQEPTSHRKQLDGGGTERQREAMQQSAQERESTARKARKEKGVYKDF